MNTTTFTTALKSHRARLQCSQEAVARALGVSLSAYCSWERGKEPKRLTQAGVLGQLDTMLPGDARLQPPHLQDRTKEVAS